MIIMEENKVILKLKDYLDLKEKAKKFDELGGQDFYVPVISKLNAGTKIEELVFVKSNNKHHFFSFKFFVFTENQKIIQLIEQKNKIEDRMYSLNIELCAVQGMNYFQFKRLKKK